jgi:hypothetical protein
MKKQSAYISIAAVMCIIVCIGEFVTIFAFGALYPGYSQLKDTMSALGSTASPVSTEISTWWLMMGILLIFFATGFKKAFKEKGVYTTIASVLIMLYGFGEGIGSGAFKMDYSMQDTATSNLLHDLLGGIGVTAILAFPLIMRKVITKDENAWFHRFSLIMFFTGIATILLFLFRYSADENDLLSLYKGLWQRLFMLNTYVYMIVIAIIMLRQRKRAK